jgi:NTP pyrophosphatase (non-canonical NTP hydrolase)
MEIKEAQKIVDEWIRSTGKGYFSPLTNMALLTEEVGEVARVISRTYGDQVAKESDKKVKLSEELADALWVIICLANQTGINLEEALMQSLHKKSVRDANRF